MVATSVAEVIEELSRIVALARDDESALGLFPALYRQVTLEVQAGISEGRFEDGDRMARLDVTFANRYLDAFDTARAGGRPSRAWRVAFAAEGERRLALQHLLLGINAHINLDLAVAAAEVGGSRLEELESDFRAIQEILESLLDSVQVVLSGFSPLLAVLDHVGGRTDEAVMGFSISAARDEAWNNAQLLCRLDGWLRDFAIRAQDRKTAFLGRLIDQPPGLLGRSIELIQELEESDVVPIIDALDQIVDPHES